MKKIIIFVLVAVFVFLLSTNCFAAEYNISDGDDEEAYDYGVYLPDKLKEILSQNGVSDIEKIEVSEILKVAFSFIKLAADKYSGAITSILVMVLFLSVIKIITDNSGGLLIIDFISNAVICYLVFDIFTILYLDIDSIFVSCSELLTAILPSFLTVTMMGGGTMSGVTLSASLGAVLTFLEVVLSQLGGSIAVLSFIFLVFERLSPLFEELNCVIHFKKYAITIVSFITTVMLTVLSFQNVLSARADSLSVRSVKFAAASFIPIVGGAVGESLRTVGSGIDYLKTTLGSAVGFALFFTVLPIITEIVVLKILLQFCSFSASLCTCGGCKKALEGFVSVIDIILVIIICSLVLSFLVVFLFTFVSFGV